MGNKRQVQPKSVNQRQYLEAIEQSDMVFGIGPAGTGKTYLAVAMAISALVSKEGRPHHPRPSRRWKPASAWASLPGTLQEKVDPYLRPLYDALYDLLEPEKVDRFLEKNVIEIAPIAFMRGRTLNDSFVILDEAQNTTSEQMKMFVTRLGFNSKAVITGDITQIDLPNRQSQRPHRGHERACREWRASASRCLPKLTWCATIWCSASSAPMRISAPATTASSTCSWRANRRARPGLETMPKKAKGSTPVQQ